MDDDFDDGTHHEGFEFAFGHCVCFGGLRGGVVYYFDDGSVLRLESVHKEPLV